jgi:hypothetical protein
LRDMIEHGSEISFDVCRFNPRRIETARQRMRRSLSEKIFTTNALTSATVPAGTCLVFGTQRGQFTLGVFS